MVRDGVANMVIRLQESGFDPRKVGPDSWEARCPAHRSADCALSITRNEFNHVLLECRSTENCQYIRIIRAVGFTNDQVYAETPDWLINRLGRAPIRPASFVSPDAKGKNGADMSAAEGANGSAGVPPPHAENAKADAVTESADASSEAIPSQHEVGAQDGPAGGATGSAAAPPSPEEAAASAQLPPYSGTESRVDSQREVFEKASVISVDAALEICPSAESGPQPVSEGRREREQAPALYRPDEPGDNLERLSSVQVLARLASSARLFRSADGRFCAQVPVGDRLEIYRLKSAAFRDWLIDGFLINQPEPPSSWAIRRVIGMLEARARFNTSIPEVFIRVGQDGDGDDSPYFLDLGDPSGRAIAISNRGWSVVDRPGVCFRRPEGLLPMPMPVHDGSIDLLRPFVNLTEPDFRLMIAWLTASLRPVGPYPILVLNGEQASAKSTLAKILRLLIDPQACPVLALPSSVENLMATAVNGWLLVYENISAIASPLSDCICQLAFGGGFASRALFTNDERSVIYAQRPVILVGIDDFVVRGDLRDRSVFLHLPPIPKTGRRGERKFWPAFRADFPRILGGVLDAIVGGLRELPSVDLKELPRMADFAEWGEATSRGLGWGAETFVSTYDDNRLDATEMVIEGSPVATLLLRLARNGFSWTGTPMGLYRALTKISSKRDGAGWPKTMHMFGSELRRIAPQLRSHGFSINFERRRGERIVTLKAEGDGISRPPTDTPQP